jgi:hypothetical protein
MMHEIHTAALHEQSGDIEEPLILKGTDEQDEKWEKESNELSRCFHLVGFLFGLWFQMISLGATVLLARNFGEEPVLQTSQDKLLFYLLFGLSYSWLLLFPIICLAVERSWTDCGNRYLREHLFYQFSRRQLTKRTIFLFAVHFLGGIILGSFATWGVIDLCIGVSTAMLTTLIASMMACTALCYTLIIVYDSCVDEDKDGAM